MLRELDGSPGQLGLQELAPVLMVPQGTGTTCGGVGRKGHNPGVISLGGSCFASLFPWRDHCVAFEVPSRSKV